MKFETLYHLKNKIILPSVEIPNGILIVTIRATLHLISEDVKVLVDGQGVVGITCGNEIGHGTRWNTQSAEDCQNVSKGCLVSIFIQMSLKK